FEHNLEHRLEKNQAVHELLNSLSGEGTPPPYGWIPSFVWRGVAPLAGRINRLATIGLLPVSLRDRWGLPWSTADQRRLCLLSAVVRFVFARLPLRWRYFSVAARAIAK
ncbi:MAG: oxygenase MpaB family protein, partial [Candidatus Dormibacteraceae bacterium]